MGFRFALLLVVFTLWLLNQKRLLFRWIIFLNAILTFGLLLNVTVLRDVLLDITAQAIKTLLIGILLMVSTNILRYLTANKAGSLGPHTIWYALHLQKFFVAAYPAGK
jgi:hypothetical protein